MDNIKEPIRILHVLGALDRGGAETMVMNLYRNIDRNRIQFDFLIHTNRECDYSNEIKNLGGKIYTISRFKGINLFKYIKEITNFYKKHPEHKIVHAHMRSTASIYLLFAKKYGKFTIAHSHNISSGKGISALVKNILQFPIRYIADYFFACSLPAGKWLFGNSVIKSNKFQVLKNAINIENFLYNEQIRFKKRKELGINSEYVIGNVGRFHEQKNHEFLINVFIDYLKINKNSLLILVGEGKLKKDIKEKVKKSKIDKNVLFFDSRNDVNELLQAFDIFLFPSKYEGLGIVAIEAQCSSLQVVCSTNVPKEVAITDNIKFMELNVKRWVMCLDTYSKINKRQIVNEKLLYDSGYDINTTVNILTNFYIGVNSL